MNESLGAFFIFLTLLSAGNQDSALNDFDCKAVLQEEKIEINVDSLMAVLAGPDEKKVKALIEKLGADDFDEREKATAALRAMGPDVLPLIKKHGVPATDIEIRLRSRTLLVEVMKESHKGYRLRRAAVAALGTLKAEKSLDALEDCLLSDDPSLRREATVALAKFGAAGFGRIDRCLRKLAETEGGEAERALALLDGLPSDEKNPGRAALVAALVGKGSRSLDIRVMEILARSGRPALLADSVRRYVVRSEKTSPLPPRFIREFLADAYGLKKSSMGWQTFRGKKSGWVDFCKKGGKIVEMKSEDAKKLISRFVEGLDGEKNLAGVESCLRFVPKDATLVGGCDMRQCRESAIGMDFDKYVGEDLACITMMKKLGEATGAFRTDLCVFYSKINISSAQGHLTLIFKGEYDSARQTETVARLLGFSRANYKGTTYIKSRPSDFGPNTAMCFLDNKYILFTFGVLGVSPIEEALDEMNKAKSPGETGLVGLLDRETLSCPSWGAVDMESLLGQVSGQLPSEVQPFTNIKTVIVKMTGIAGEKVELRARAVCKDAKSAQDVSALCRKYVKMGIEDLKKGLRFREENLYYWHSESDEISMKLVMGGMESLQFTTDGNIISATATVNLETLRKIFLQEEGFREMSAEMTRALAKSGETLPDSYVVKKELEENEYELLKIRKKHKRADKILAEMEKKRQELEKKPPEERDDGEIERMLNREERIRDYVKEMITDEKECVEEIKNLKEEMKEIEKTGSSSKRRNKKPDEPKTRDEKSSEAERSSDSSPAEIPEAVIPPPAPPVPPKQPDGR